ncbi:MBL fold metallo-hydrolase [Halomonas mongoliensis]|uniref:MBL fold metallo-hydrolase n=1 Tax=Halomonas mongoliensis TaxID=321265 RepID=UPI00403AD02F
MPNAVTKTERSMQAPEATELLEVAKGVFRYRIPLPGKPYYTNIWLLRDTLGYSVVDTGMYSPAAESAWSRLLAILPEDKPIHRVFVTHLHPDHVGMAGWLLSNGARELWMTRTEYLACSEQQAYSYRRSAPDEFIEFYRAAGWSDLALRHYQSHQKNHRNRVSPLPRSYHRLKEGQQHSIGGYYWKVISGSGHSPEHACLYCRDLGLFISGDQVLPGISSNVSVTPVEPMANPMQDWLHSLNKIKSRIPDNVLVLPAHQKQFTGLHERIDELKEKKINTIRKTKETLKHGPSRIVDFFESLYGRTINEDNFMTFILATGETLACLNYLKERKEANFTPDKKGVHWYHSC